MKSIQHFKLEDSSILAVDRGTELVGQVHQRFLRFLDSTKVGKVELNLILKQLGTEIPRASAYVPVLLAQSFGITKWQIVHEATFANFCLDFFSRSIDAATDRSDMNPLTLHLGSLCLGKAAQVYGEFVTRNDGFWKFWEQYLNEASEAERVLWSHRNAIISFSRRDLELLGQKSALLKMSGAIYASLTNRWEILDTIENGLMSTASGVQIADDLLDWEQDFRAGIYTYPLVVAHEKRLADQSIESSINSTDVLRMVLDMATQKLEYGKVLFQKVHAISMVLLIDTLLKSVEEVKINVLEKSRPEFADDEVFRIKHIRRMIDPKLGH